MKQFDDFDILVAKCGRSIGLKGELKLTIYTDFQEIFNPQIPFKCSDKILYIDHFNPSRNVVKFREINDVDSAKQLTLNLLYTTKEATKEFCNISDCDYFWFDIIGCIVFDGEIMIGVVEDIERIANVDYLLVATETNLKKTYPHIKAKKFMLPYIPRYIVSTNVLQKKINTIDTLAILEMS